MIFGKKHTQTEEPPKPILVNLPRSPITSSLSSEKATESVQFYLYPTEEEEEKVLNGKVLYGLNNLIPLSKFLDNGCEPYSDGKLTAWYGEDVPKRFENKLMCEENTKTGEMIFHLAFIVNYRV